MARKLERTWPVLPPPHPPPLRRTKTLLSTCTHITAPLAVAVLTIFISTGDTPGPLDNPDDEANDPDVIPPKPLPEEPVPLTPEQVKEQGNEAFKSKNYTKAIDLYTQAIGEGTRPHESGYSSLTLDQTYLRVTNRRTLRTERPHIWPSNDSNRPSPIVNRPPHCKRSRRPQKH